MKYANLWKQSIVFLCILMISGCATFQFAPTPPSLYTQQTYTLEDYKADLALYQRDKATVAEKTRFRDKIVYSTASEIDKNYREFKDSFFGERAATETLLDITQIGLGTAGTIAGGITTVNILAAISTGVAGSRLSFNKNFFKEKSPDLLLSRMDALRAGQWLQIYQKLQKDAAAYPLYEAERDLIAYFEKGTLQAAFQDVVAESGTAQQKADNDIKDITRARVNVPPSDDESKQEKDIGDAIDRLTDLTKAQNVLVALGEKDKPNDITEARKQLIKLLRYGGHDKTKMQAIYEAFKKEGLVK
jgi:hypothetical protein